MERLGEILGQSRDPETTPNLKTPDKPTYYHKKDDLDYHEPTPEERKEALRRRLNLTSWDNTFENFKPVKGVEESLTAFKELASGNATWSMLLCYGSDGCGKTHLCEALSIEMAKREVLCRVNEWAEVVRDLKRRMHSEVTDDYDMQFRSFQKRDYLMLDDVGMGSTGSSWEWGELEEIINYRYREGLFTVVTTNLDIKDVPRRIVSRFTDAVQSRLVLNSGGNYRPKKVIK